MKEILIYYTGSFNPYNAKYYDTENPKSQSIKDLMFMMALPNDKFFNSVSNIITEIYNNTQAGYSPNKTDQNINLSRFLLAKLIMDTDRERNPVYAAYQDKLTSNSDLCFIIRENSPDISVSFECGGLKLTGRSVKTRIAKCAIYIPILVKNIETIKSLSYPAEPTEPVKPAESVKPQPKESSSSSSSSSDSDSDSY
jgi:hypothetical protein